MTSVSVIQLCFMFQFFSLFIPFRNSMCKEVHVCVSVCVCVCMCVAVNSHTCCIQIVNDITDSNTCFLFQFFFFYCILE